MQVTTFQNISTVLSGGSANIDPTLSLGGEPSSTLILDGVLDNLFSDVNTTQAADGWEDYRCFYIFNDGDTAIYGIRLWIASDYQGGAGVELGIQDTDEIQRIIVNYEGNTILGGYLRLSYKDEVFDVPYDNDLTMWAISLQNSLNGLIKNGQLLLGDAAITAQQTATETIFDIVFGGQNGKRNHDSIIIVSNSLVSAPSETNVILQTLQQGSPINSIAPQVDLPSTPPGGVGFYLASSTYPIELPLLAPGEGFPLWVKRVVAPGTAAKAGDGFILRFSAESFET